MNFSSRRRSLSRAVWVLGALSAVPVVAACQDGDASSSAGSSSSPFPGKFEPHVAELEPGCSGGVLHPGVWSVVRRRRADLAGASR